MDFKITFTKKAGRRGPKGFALVEILVAVGVAAILFTVVCGFAMFCSRSFAALYNYIDLDDINRVAIDQLTRDVRQSNRVTSYDTNGMSLTLEDADGTPISYVFNSNTHTLVRTRGTDVRVILKECEKLNFWIGQRNTDVGGYDVFKAASIATAKVINVSWVCSRSILGQKQNTESVQTARIVIRKQGT